MRKALLVLALVQNICAFEDNAEHCEKMTYVQEVDQEKGTTEKTYIPNQTIDQSEQAASEAHSDIKRQEATPSGLRNRNRGYSPAERVIVATGGTIVVGCIIFGIIMSQR